MFGKTAKTRMKKEYRQLLHQLGQREFDHKSFPWERFKQLENQLMELGILPKR